MMTKSKNSSCSIDSCLNLPLMVDRIRNDPFKNKKIRTELEGVRYMLKHVLMAQTDYKVYTELFQSISNLESIIVSLEEKK